MAGGAAGDDDLVAGRALPGTPSGPSEPARAPSGTADAADREAVLHVYGVEMLYAAVVGYPDWRTAIVEVVLRASLSGDTAMHFRGHERCVSALANLLQFTNVYRRRGGCSCECRYCRFMGGLRNYLAHEWAKDDERFAIPAGSGGAATSGRDRTRRPTPSASGSGPTRRR